METKNAKIQSKNENKNCISMTRFIEETVDCMNDISKWDR